MYILIVTMSVVTPDQPHRGVRVTMEARLGVRFCSDDCGTPHMWALKPAPMGTVRRATTLTPTLSQWEREPEKAGVPESVGAPGDGQIAHGTGSGSKMILGRSMTDGPDGARPHPDGGNR
jgi:hypothetical protein